MLIKLVNSGCYIIGTGFFSGQLAFLNALLLDLISK